MPAADLAYFCSPEPSTLQAKAVDCSPPSPLQHPRKAHHIHHLMFKSRIAVGSSHLHQQHQAASLLHEQPKKKKATGAAAQFSSASDSKAATPSNALPSSGDRQSDQSRFYHQGCCDSSSSGYHKTRLNLAQVHRG